MLDNVWLKTLPNPPKQTNQNPLQPPQEQTTPALPPINNPNPMPLQQPNKTKPIPPNRPNSKTNLIISNTLYRSII